MPRAVTVNAYKYEELSPAAQSRARDWWRDASKDYPHTDWSDYPTSDLKTVAAFMGWTVTDTAFSGFSSQGDGAQFTGTWRAADVKAAEALEKHAPAAGSAANTLLRSIMASHVTLAKEAPEASASVRGTGRYSHSRATEFETPNLTRPQLNALIETGCALMDWYYRALEDSYEASRSDEVVAENITANEYEFTEDGNRSVTL